MHAGHDYIMLITSDGSSHNICGIMLLSKLTRHRNVNKKDKRKNKARKNDKWLSEKQVSKTVSGPPTLIQHTV